MILVERIVCEDAQLVVKPREVARATAQREEEISQMLLAALEFGWILGG